MAFYHSMRKPLSSMILSRESSLPRELSRQNSLETLERNHEGSLLDFSGFFSNRAACQKPLLDATMHHRHNSSSSSNNSSNSNSSNNNNTGAIKLLLLRDETLVGKSR